MKKELKKQIEQFAKSENITFLRACTAFQEASAQKGNEEVIKLIAELKRESDEYKKILG
jgi:uncharacterized protein (UPF0210 family)